MIHGHGGNIYHLARQLGCQPFEIADMSSNVNPLGPPPELLEYLGRHLDRIKALPEADAGSMVQQFADRSGISADQVVAGNGSTQMIYDLPRALGLREALIVGPTYADYADSCLLNGVSCRFLHAREGEDFIVDLNAIRDRIEPAAAVYICNPNNPTGRLMNADALRQLCRDFPRQHFIIDESYLPFIPPYENHSLLQRRPANAIVLHSMSKIFRIPGLRVGFAVGEPETIARLRRFALPWSVNSLAQTAVHFLLENETLSRSFIQRSQQFVAGQREGMTRRLSAIPGVYVCPSLTSFFILRLPAHHQAETICRRMSEAKILIRDCTNFKGLSERFVRISLKTPEINRRCTERLQTLFQA